MHKRLDTNCVAPLGPNVAGFEQDLEKFIGANTHIAALSSGTSAIELGLLLLSTKTIILVIVPPYKISPQLSLVPK